MKVNILCAPTAPEWAPERMAVVLDRKQFTPVLSVSWTIQTTGSFKFLRGSQILVRDERSNETMCLKYLYNLSSAVNPNYSIWTFALEGLVVQPEHTYEVSVYNIPEPNFRNDRIKKKIGIPGCNDEIIKRSQKCRENGSLWEPLMSTNASLDRIQKLLSIVVSFDTSEYSEKYDVSIKSPGDLSTVTVLQENQTSLNVKFELRPWRCKFEIKIQPFFKHCTNNCSAAEKSFDYCSYYPPRTLLVKMVIGGVVGGACLAYFLLSTCATCFHPLKSTSESTSLSAHNGTPQCTQRPTRRRLLIIYSLDHPLYKNIVLKLCSFLMTKCGTEVVLDMLDSARLGMIGGLQWLEWHKQQIEKSSDKILILCSRGVQAKWSAMCTGKLVQLREDLHSTVGDMLVPAFCLMVPEFVKSASFEKYIVAYFDSVSTEDDVPSPFNITVRYKLMKHFEELFFRILGSEKHEMGRVNRIEGLSESDYHLCPTGSALRTAIEDFHAYQMEHPHWFEEELIENVEMDIDSDVSVSQDEAGQIKDLVHEATTILLSEQSVHMSLKL
ncbi:interleukin-17 receptor A [Eucyclogobius newberryi]|uniref:interleukin-17 receptor A n=1 Tax=Eucyclogobius newberryi TaxID=166745 RepID=UPI003B5CFE4E